MAADGLVVGLNHTRVTSCSHSTGRRIKKRDDIWMRDVARHFKLAL